MHIAAILPIYALVSCDKMFYMLQIKYLKLDSYDYTKYRNYRVSPCRQPHTRFHSSRFMISQSQAGYSTVKAYTNK